MSLAKRLTKIETSLTPMQVALVWLKKVRQLDLNTFLDNSKNEDPMVRIPEMAATAVRENHNTQATIPGFAQYAEFEARRQAGFLVTLVINLHNVVITECARAQLLLVPGLLHAAEVELYRAGARIDEPVRPSQAASRLAERLGQLWLLRATIAEISRRYYDGHPLLVAGAESHLNEYIQALEALAHADRGAELPPLDLVALESSLKQYVPAQVQQQVLWADAQVLSRFSRELIWLRSSMPAAWIS